MLIAEIAIAAVYGMVELLHQANGTVTYDMLSPSWLLHCDIGAELAIAIRGLGRV